MYENRTVEEVCREFSVDLRTGLSAAEVEVRQRIMGKMSCGKHHRGV